MDRENIAPYIYYKGEVLKRAGLNTIKNITLKIPFFRFFYENIVAPFGAVDEKIKKENPYMEQIINNIEKKKKEKANEKFEKMFPAYAEKHKAEIEKRNSMTLKEAVNELTQILEK